MPPAYAGDHAKSEWGYLTGDVGNYIPEAQFLALRPHPHGHGALRAGPFREAKEEESEDIEAD